DGTPDGPKLHSIIVDPRDAAHLIFGMSGGGVHESHDAGRTWRTLIEGLEVVEGFDAKNVSFHDPHCVRQCPTNLDRLYQQNHCGIFRMDRNGGAPSDVWQRIGRKMLKRVGDAGFPMVVHPHDADTCWVFPMDAATVWPRTSPQGRPAAYMTRNAGRTWQRLDDGLPASQAWWTVKRQAMTADAQPVPALYLGTTSGELWIGRDEGARWSLVARHLPEIYAVDVAEVA
ncbi:MAG: glycosyl hydrolase, partial [Burkholderiaceae bacterium]|nr:glycosyl hydrolase [Burkholderiaceae bacterium]